MYFCHVISLWHLHFCIVLHLRVKCYRIIKLRLQVNPGILFAFYNINTIRYIILHELYWCFLRTRDFRTKSNFLLQLLDRLIFMFVPLEKISFISMPVKDCIIRPMFDGLLAGMPLYRAIHAVTLSLIFCSFV